MISDKYLKFIKSHPLESLPEIKMIEKYFQQKRGYVFKMPKKNSSVISLFSGGLDSVSQSFYLMKKYGLRIYPLFLRRGQKRVHQEEKSVRYYEKIFRKIFPDLFMPVFIMDAAIPPQKIRFTITNVSNEFLDKKIKFRRGVPYLIPMMLTTAAYYSHYIEIKYNLHIRDIFVNLVSRDGTAFIYETLTGLRNTMYHLCSLSRDYTWQVTSIAIEKELGNFLEKDYFIKYCHSHGLDLSRTYTCFHDGLFHCGECMGCYARKIEYGKSGINDSTVYQNALVYYRILQKLKRIFQNI